jgi:hypothetical protein
MDVSSSRDGCSSTLRALGITPPARHRLLPTDHCSVPEGLRCGGEGDLEDTGDGVGGCNGGAGEGPDRLFCWRPSKNDLSTGKTIGPPRMMRKTGFLRVLSLSKHRQVSEKSNSAAPHLIWYRQWVVNRCVNEMVSPLANVEDVAIVCRSSLLSMHTLLRSLLELVGQ